MDKVFEAEHITDKSETLVLLTLGNWSDDEGNCFPSLKKLSKKARLSKKGLTMVMKRLRHVYVNWDDNKGGRNRRNRYRLNLKAIENREYAEALWRQKSEQRTLFDTSEKGVPTSPFKKADTVNQVHPLKSEPSTPFKAERVNPVPLKGELGSLAYIHQEPSIPPLPPQRASGGDGFCFFVDSEKHYAKTAARLLRDYSDPVEMAAAHLEFKPNKNMGASLVAIHAQYGDEMYAGAIAQAAVDHKGGRLDRFITSVCRRFTFQMEDFLKRAEKARRSLSQSAAPVPTYQQPDEDLGDLPLEFASLMPESAKKKVGL